MTINVFHRFNRPITAGRLNLAGQLDRTRQEFKDECDINFIMKRYEATGVMPQPWKSPPVGSFADFASAPDFMEAQTIIARSREQFATLPARVRDRFQNNPAHLLAFLEDEGNLGEARSLGLLKDEPAPIPATPPKEG